MALIRMLYVCRDPEGKEIIDLLRRHDIGYRLFYCDEDERREYQCPRLLTSEGDWVGKDAIERYIGQVPFFQSQEAQAAAKRKF